jgi:transformation/transcription domain-associated protein
MPMGQAPRMPQELLDEILSILKTAFPLLALSMEKMVDHINVRAQPPKEEDVYRFFFALLSDAMGVSWIGGAVLVIVVMLTLKNFV